MTRAPIRTGLAVAALVAVAWPAATAATASAQASRRASWQLVDHHDARACADDAINPARFAVYVDGTWHHALTVRVTQLPKRARYSGTVPAIAKGSSDGRAPVAYEEVHIAPDTPAGTYEGRMTVTDGTTRKDLIVELRVKARCGY